MEAPNPEKLQKAVQEIEHQITLAESTIDPSDKTPFNKAIERLKGYLAVIRAECKKILE